MQAKPTAASLIRVGTFSDTTLLAFPVAKVDRFLSGKGKGLVKASPAKPEGHGRVASRAAGGLFPGG